jgi:DNA-binding CsgD family transcriptional regulator
MTKKITPELDREQLVSQKIREVSAFAGMVPGVIIIHELPEFSLRYMSPLGLQLLGKEWDEIKGISSEEYHKRFFNPDFASDSVPKILGIIEKNTDEVVSFFQQVRTSKDREWDWYMTALKILLRDLSNTPLLTISVAMKIDPESYFTAKGARLLEENNFLRANHDKFSRLTKRERQILQLMALGKSAAEIAKELAITVATAETHRKKIKHKLEARNSYALSQFARAFDIL